MKPRDIFLAGITGGSVPCPATGSATSIVTTDLMDQVGAWFPEGHLEPEPMAALAAAGYTQLGFENVMPLFSVWHEMAALGSQVNWGRCDLMPDSRDPLCGDINVTVQIPGDFLHRSDCAVPLEALKLLKQRYGDEVAVVGKVFGPWTLGFHVYGIENFLIASVAEPDALRKAMRALIEVTVQFGRAQIEAGADALPLADHATRDLCSPDAYRDFLIEIHQEINERLDCPLILHVCGDTADRIEYIRQSGVGCFHFDSKVPTATARELAGNRLALMGGTSNLTIVRQGTPDQIADDVQEKLRCGIEVIGPECAVPLDAPYQNLKRIADEVKQARSILPTTT